jgi:cephalosporin hydroxylase
MNEFQEETAARISSMAGNRDLQALANEFLIKSTLPKYSYNFNWQGRPIIQYPQDMVAMQELIWSIKPDLIIETGIAHGGSLIFSASMLALLDLADAIETGEKIDPRLSKRKVLGIDIDIRSHNKVAIEAHPMASRIRMIQGSSVAPEIVNQVRTIAADYSRVLVCLDSNHTHEHVLEELKAYAPLVSLGSYCVVFDTVVEDMPKEMFPDRHWGPGNNPKTAVFEYIKLLESERIKAADGRLLVLEIDKSIDHKLLISVAPDGYLKRVM